MHGSRNATGNKEINIILNKHLQEGTELVHSLCLALSPASYSSSANL